MKIKKRGDNESEDDENEINVEGDATSDDDDEIMKNDYHFKNFYQN